MQLMCHLEIDKRDIERKFNINFEEYFAADIPKMQTFIDENLLVNDKDKIKIIGAGILIIQKCSNVFRRLFGKNDEGKTSIF